MACGENRFRLKFNAFGQIFDDDLRIAGDGGTDVRQFQLVHLVDTVIIGLILKDQGEDAGVCQVRAVDAREALDVYKRQRIDLLDFADERIPRVCCGTLVLVRTFCKRGQAVKEKLFVHAAFLDARGAVQLLSLIHI